MMSGEQEPETYPEPALSEFATELSLAAEDAAQTLGTKPRDAKMQGGPAAKGSIDIQTIMRIPVTMKVVIGAATLSVSELNNLKTGEVVSLNRRVGEPVDIVVNGQVLARGVLVIVDRESSQLGVTLTEVAGSGGSLSYSTTARR
jgi:flagellar motor switch protein FliN/FliY